MGVLQNFQKFGVLWHKHTKLAEVPGTGMEVLTEVSEVPGTGMKVLQNFQKLRVLWHGRTETYIFYGQV